MRPLYVAERGTWKRWKQISARAKPRYQPAATSPNLPPRSRGNTPLTSSVIKLFLDTDLWFTGLYTDTGWDCRGTDVMVGIGREDTVGSV